MLEDLLSSSESDEEDEEEEEDVGGDEGEGRAACGCREKS